MKIAYVASEITPYASTGGLAEVAGALPPALVELGHDVLRFMPMYRTVLEGHPACRPAGLSLNIPVGFRSYTAEIWYSDSPAPRTYFIRRDEYFDRSCLYNLPDRDYDDNFERYVFFQKAVVALMDALKFSPDVVHGNDWQCGLMPYFLSQGWQGNPRSRPEPFVFTIHNLAYQGIYPGSDYAETNLPFNCFSVGTVEFYGKINCLKGGVTGARAITTVSPTYAREICTRDNGYGLDGLMASLGTRLSGILNGIDTRLWNPGDDPHLETPYHAAQLAGKGTCRLSFQTQHRLRPSSTTLGMVTRLVAQKGLDLVAEIMPELMKRDVSLFIMGSGDERFHQLCLSWKANWPDRFGCHLGYEAGLAHQVMAYSDFLLIPSRYEPCGLSQFYGMRYGALPVAHAVGGLVDSVTDVGAGDGSTGTGILFHEPTAKALLNAVDRALALRAKSAAYAMVQKRAMQSDHSWAQPARQYAQLYDSVRQP